MVRGSGGGACIGHPALLLPGGLEREQGFPLERPPAFAILPKVGQR